MIDLKLKNADEIETLSAFPMPAPGDRVVYDSDTQTPIYFAHLVKITNKTGAMITFTGVDLRDTGTTMKSYSVSLSAINHVWPALPSSLDGWDAATNNCAILFLSNSYVSGKPDLAAAMEDPGNKWPRGSAEAPVLRNRIRKLEEELKGFDAIKSRLREFQTSLEAGPKSRFEEMFKGLID